MAHTQVATGGLMEKIEARALTNKKARANFYQPDVQYERLTPIMRRYLETVGEKLVVACSRGMAEEAKRANILAAMPKNAPGYETMARNFELERIREQKIIQKILNERDQKLAKATRFQKHIPPPSNPDAWTDNEDWVNAVMKQAALLGIDSKREKEYELLPLAAESLEAPLPPGWKRKRGGSREMLRNGYDSLSSSMSGKSTVNSKQNQEDSGQNQDSSKKVLTSYVNKSTGAVLFEHPLNSYFRSITSTRKVAQELDERQQIEQNRQGGSGEGYMSKSMIASYQRCSDAEHAMRLVMDKLLNPNKYIQHEDDLSYDNEYQHSYINNNDDVDNIKFTLPSNRTQIATRQQVSMTQHETQSLTYRESVNLGKHMNQNGSQTALPKLTPYQAGVEVDTGFHSSSPSTRQQSRQQGNRISFSPGSDGQSGHGSPLHSPTSNSTISFKWSEDDEIRQDAFQNVNNYNNNGSTSSYDSYSTTSRPPSSIVSSIHRPKHRSVLSDQRDERRRQAELTDTHTQKISAPQGCFNDELYASARRVVGQQRNKNNNKFLPLSPTSHQTTTRQQTSSRRGQRSSPQNTSTSTRLNTSSSTRAMSTRGGGNRKDENGMTTSGGSYRVTNEMTMSPPSSSSVRQSRPGTTHSQMMRTNNSSTYQQNGSAGSEGGGQQLRRAVSLPPSPSPVTMQLDSSFKRGEKVKKSNPLASFMNDF